MNLGFQVPLSSDEEEEEQAQFECRVHFTKSDHQRLKKQLEQYMDEEDQKEENYYDPLEDLKNEEWMKAMTEIEPKQSKKTEYESDDEEEVEFPLEEKSLSCPGCFTQVCGECQAHETHKNQYRALRVKNCVIDETELVKPKGYKKKEFELFFKIRCGKCGAELGIYEFEEKVYHFVNAIG